MPDFRAVLGHKLGSIEKPKPVPIGSYSAIIHATELAEVGQNKTPGVRVTFLLQSPGEDVDMDHFADFGGMEALTRRKVNTTFWLTEDALYRLKDFLTEVCLIEGAEERSIGEVLPEINRLPCIVVIKHNYDNKQNLRTDVESVLAPS